MKPINFLALAAFFLNVIAHAEGHEGHGGGLIERNGNTLTFKSAGVRVKLDQPLSDLELPEAQETMQALDSILISPDLALKIQDAIRIRSTRRYYKISASQISAEQNARILSFYKKSVRAHLGDHIVIGAITLDKDTFLLPSFFKLRNKNSRLAIILHEALWSLQSDIWISGREERVYQQVIQSEISFEKCLDQPVQPLKRNQFGSKRICQDWIASLGEALHHPNFEIQGAGLIDYAQNNIEGLLDEQGRMKAVDFLGEEFVKTNGATYGCLIWRKNIEHQLQLYPQSLFLKYMLYHDEEVCRAHEWKSAISPFYVRGQGGVLLSDLLLKKQDEGFSVWDWNQSRAAPYDSLELIRFSDAFVETASKFQSNSRIFDQIRSARIDVDPPELRR